MYKPHASAITRKEMIGQTIMIKANPEEHIKQFGSLKSFLERYPVGGIFVGAEIIKKAGCTAEDVTTVIADYQQASKIPLFVAADIESGAGGIVSDLTRLPRQLSLGAADSEELAYAYGKVSAVEAVSMGINWSFSPVCDLNLNRHNLIVSNRSVSDDPEKAVRLLTKLVKGMQEYGIAATAKHFPGDGVDHRDQHIVTTCNSLTWKQWESYHGKVFQTMINEGILSVMAGHISFPAYQNQRHNGYFLPATLSHELISGLLKSHLKFDGVVVSDALDMGGFIRVYGDRDAAELEAFKAGIDVMLWPSLSFFDHVEAALDANRISFARLEDAYGRINNLKQRLGLVSFTESRIKSQNVSMDKNEVRLTGEELAKSIAQQSVSLVVNRWGLLPISSIQGMKIKVVGITPDDSLYTITGIVARELASRGAEVTVQRNWVTYGKDVRGMDNDCDVILYVLMYDLQQPLGTIQFYGDEARSIVSALSFAQEKTVIISFGSPYYFAEYFENAPAFVNAYSNDEETVKATIAALCGEVLFVPTPPINLYGKMESLLMK